VAFFLAACRQGGIVWTKRQRHQKAGLKDVLCQLLQISSESAGGLFIPLSAARRTVFVAYVA
jgi:hypothetical protein